ncbi:MAG: carbohydrate porin [Opitutaceae bacterium]|nr:carbohydrate porin [Opitutaceae bacterium]
MKRNFAALLALALFRLPLAGQEIESNNFFQPYASATLETWSLLDGGVGSGNRSMGLIDLGADFELSEQTKGHFNFFAFGGDRDVDGFTGDFGVFSNIITDSKVILFTAWLEHSFDDMHIRFGQLASDESFYVSESGALFINANFGAIPTVSANVSAPIFSVGSAGIEWLQELNTGYWKTAVYAGDPGPGNESDHGLNWKMGGEAGYFFIAERGWNYHATREQNSVFKIGAYYHSGIFESFSQDSNVKGNHAFYAIVDHSIGDSISVFSRIGFNPKSDRSAVTRYFDLGVNLNGFVESRPDDTLGIAYSRTSFSSDDAIRPAEEVFEITYASQLAAIWSIQPSIQWILNARETSKDALVAGIRLTTDF